MQRSSSDLWLYRVSLCCLWLAALLLASCADASVPPTPASILATTTGQVGQTPLLPTVADTPVAAPPTSTAALPLLASTSVSYTPPPAALSAASPIPTAMPDQPAFAPATA